MVWLSDSLLFVFSFIKISLSSSENSILKNALTKKLIKVVFPLPVSPTNKIVQHESCSFGKNVFSGSKNNL